MLLKKLLTVITLILSYQAIAQPNLVPNPSFEDYRSCPLSVSGVPYSKIYSHFKTVNDWSNPVKYTTPDYYNSCAPYAAKVSVPFNTFGHQPARTGNAYMGVVAFNGNTTQHNTFYYAEHIYCKLTEPLKAGFLYTITFYVSATYGGSSSTTPRFSVDRFGAHLSDTIAYNEDVTKPFSLPYHVRSTKGVILKDTTGWMKISGDYLANGGEQYLYIGNFYNPDEAPEIEQIYPATPLPTQTYLSYYYIDDVSVKKYVQCDTFVNTHSKTICNNSPVLLSSSVNGADSYTWNNGLDNKSINVYEPGTYWVTATKDTCDYYVDTFKVTSKNLIHQLSLGNDTALCKGSVLRLGENLKDHQVQYKWSNGSNLCCIDIVNDGNYTLSVSDGCNTIEDSIEVIFFECIDCIWAPTGFTPNSDGHNDVFKAFSRCPLEEYRIVIANRWGEVVFTSNDINTGWDGTHNNYDAPVGTYYYFIKYRTTFKMWREVYKGEITLIK